MQPVPTPPVPQHCPTPVELDDLELLTSGALGDLTAFNQPGSPVTLTLPEPVAAQARSVGAVELVDPEGLPLARVSWPRRRGRPADPRAVRPVPRPDAHARGVPRDGTPAARSSRSATPLTTAQLDGARRARPGHPARPHRHRHAVALAGRPGPRHPRRGGAAAGRGRRHRPAALARRRRGRPRAGRAGRRGVRGGRPGARLSPTTQTASTRTRSPRSSTTTARRRTGRAWCCSSPACPAAASPRWPARWSTCCSSRASGP